MTDDRRHEPRSCANRAGCSYVDAVGVCPVCHPGGDERVAAYVRYLHEQFDESEGLRERLVDMHVATLRSRGLTPTGRHPRDPPVQCAPLSSETRAVRLALIRGVPGLEPDHVFWSDWE